MTQSNMEDIFAYIDTRRQEYLARLIDYVRRPSISAHGVGIAETGFNLLTPLWQATYEAVRDCPCEDGCPSCIQSPKCGNNNQPLDKQAAILILGELLE